MIIRSLSKEDIPQMYMAFNEAFSDYNIRFQLSFEQFLEKFIKKLNINFSASCGVFDEEKLAGFIFTRISEYNGLPTAYNGGTGVILSYRHQNFTGKMYEFLFPVFRKLGVEQCILEVITTNKKALNAYEKIGFKKRRHFHCFKLSSRLKAVPGSTKVLIQKADQPDWPTYHQFFDFAPSFLDSSNVLATNLYNEKIIEAYMEDKFAGYAIFQPKTGRISQLAVAQSARAKGIGNQLLRQIYHDSEDKNLTIINIPTDAKKAIQYLMASGFENQLDQFEMVRKA